MFYIADSARQKRVKELLPKVREEKSSVSFSSNEPYQKTAIRAVNGVVQSLRLLLPEEGSNDRCKFSLISPTV